ncbi:MAG TPA: co-chaperone DjlA [Chromatiales bacterium]|nr:co-chaperone DjlA [Chromatiales bacterium]
MNWIGKLGGGVLGYIAGGIVGAAIGVLLGHQFDRGLGNFDSGSRGRTRPDGKTGAARQQVFFETTFQVMGHLAKIDGRVSEEEIQAARAAMHRMRLHPEAVRRAIECFNAGKRDSFQLGPQLARFRQVCGRDRGLVHAFLEFQMDLVLSKGSIKSTERELLWQIAEQLGVGRVELAQMEAILRARRSFGAEPSPERGHSELEQAYRALGLVESATDQEVKVAYRRLMNQHHPDKLVSRGLPDSMLEAAKERTREIRAAYELIRERRQLK